ncbi:MAG: 1-aminocyclopropane-1-carboxylate deaminase [Flavobacteriales bacterium TMED123]|nr:MAG: 1-aminocyclopropane-1-carboxylate deaminase [Flavobacteriales bacterium TMED123]|tara:strand:+ start:330 stop:1226 length:897 start_codon:yes stop_codon:yes gene_type:complete
MKIESQEISLSLLKEKAIRLFVKRIDKMHPFIAGNKWYKLKYNLIEAKKQQKKTVLTFGGAYSNHIAATAFATKENNLKSIGIIRGEEHFRLNPTLAFAKANGMDLNYKSRSDYRTKKTSDFLVKLKQQFGEFYLIPEGGTNMLAIQGTVAILDKNDTHDIICCAVGTGGTMAGIINASNKQQTVIGFPAIKGIKQLEHDIRKWTNKENWKLINDYVFGGYAKLSDKLVDFIIDFNNKHQISLDAIYTGKMMLGILDLISKDYFPKGSSILVIHSGGLQGNKGMNERLGLSLPTNQYL